MFQLGLDPVVGDPAEFDVLRREARLAERGDDRKMPTKKLCVLLLALAFLAAATHAADSEDGAQESGKVDWKLSAQLRLRGEARDNLDLDDTVGPAGMELRGPASDRATRLE